VAAPALDPVLDPVEEAVALVLDPVEETITPVLDPVAEGVVEPVVAPALDPVVVEEAVAPVLEPVLEEVDPVLPSPISAEPETGAGAATALAAGVAAGVAPAQQPSRAVPATHEGEEAAKGLSSAAVPSQGPAEALAAPASVSDRVSGSVAGLPDSAERIAEEAFPSARPGSQDDLLPLADLLSADLPVRNVAVALELRGAQDAFPHGAPHVPFPVGVPPAGGSSGNPSGGKSGAGDSLLAVLALLSISLLGAKALRYHGVSLVPSSALRPDIEHPG
jgi:hypothetical protein